jgi:hypothetical protein
MGLFMDILEDRAERSGILEPSAFSSRPAASATSSIAPTDVAIPYSFKCTVCLKRFRTRQNLVDHMYSMHRDSKFYVRVDTRVANPCECIDRPIQSLELISNGKDAIEVIAEANARRLTAEVQGGCTLDLVTALGIAPDYQGEIRIMGRIGAYQQTYRIVLKTASEQCFFDSRSLDALIMKVQAPLLEGRHACTDDLRTEILRVPPHSPQERYLRGFYEYYLACNYELESEWDAAKPRLEEAFGLLRCFTSCLAQTATTILAFKMGAYWLLRKRKRSIFHPVGCFFASPLEAARPTRRTAVPPTLGVWLDEFHEAVLGIVNHYYNGKLGSADDDLRSLPRSLAEAPGNYLKTLVLTARIADALADRQRSRQAWQELTKYPKYAEEARRALT